MVGINLMLNSNKDLFHYNLFRHIDSNKNRIYIFEGMLDLFLYIFYMYDSILNHNRNVEYIINMYLTINDKVGKLHIDGFFN